MWSGCLSTLALMGAVRNVAGRFEAETGIRIDADFAPTIGLLDRLRGGEAADVVILTKEALDDLAAKGTVAPESCADLARSYVGIAMKAGAGHPDISTEAALRSTLLGARSVAYSRIGASGIFFAKLIEQMGIAAEINARATVTSGFTAERAGQRRGRHRGSAAQRVEAGFRRRTCRAAPASSAEPPCGVFRRTRNGVAARPAIRRPADIPCLAGSGARVARVGAGALNPPEDRS